MSRIGKEPVAIPAGVTVKAVALESGKLLSEVATESGFVSEKSFFRTFKDVTGVTPGEWKKSH